jgi:hypothetical protein
MSNKKETTLEEFAEKLARAFDNDNYKALMDLVIDGAKWQAERMYSDMQEYAEFCIECDRKEMPLLLVQDWYEHYKNQNNEQ